MNIHENTKITAYHSISQHVGQSSLQVSSRTTSSKWIGKFTSAVCTRAPTVQPKNWSLKQPMTMSRALASQSAWCCYDHEQPSVAKLYAYATYVGKHIVFANILAKSRGSQKLCLNQKCESAGLGTESSYFLGCVMLISMHCEVLWFQTSWPRKAPKSVAKNMVVGGTVSCLRGF